ncbi:hypothetical protein XENOCAPTIV_030994 [Xenoophorus captivus]|uniref:Homeobox domain-containing protein n=1 Tax=Xenoophorus captivus TaxID=1517983 RepID=A0ABV0QUH9_9TELE
MFNGTISSVPQTLTVVAPQISSNSSSNQAADTTASKHLPSAASVLQSVPCQILGQNSLVLTPVANGSSVTCAPLALTVANQVAQSLKRPLATPVIATESKRPSIIQTLSAPTGMSKLASSKMLRSSPVLVRAEASAPVPDGPVKKAVPSQFPLLERVKGKSSEQLKALEESFQRSSSPTEKELDQLAQETRLSKTEVDCWFSERCALRDNMEKVLLTMASKNMEDRLERWPSPEEYSQLELQTNLGRTDIVRWFKDHRSALKNGETLDWMEALQKKHLADEQKAGQQQNGQISENNRSVSLEVKAVNVEEASGNVAAAENSKLSSQDKGHWLAKRLTQGVTDLCRTRKDQNSCGASDKGRESKSFNANSPAIVRQVETTDQIRGVSDVITMRQGQLGFSVEALR